MNNLKLILKKALSLAKPPPKLTVSEWADRYRRLSAEASSEHGQWITSRAEYQRGMMDALSDPEVHTVVVMSSAQIGKTEQLLNVIGFYSHQDPSPILLLQPTLEMAETFSKDRLSPMIRDTQVITELFAPAKSRGSGNTLRHKTFVGGHITMAGANSPASLASRPIRICLMDEVDRYPFSAGTEGDPVNLAKKRTTTFHNRKIYLTSTPTVKGASRIEQAYNESDKRKFEVKCPHCNDYGEMKWANVHWDEDRPQTASYVCPSCGSLWSEKDRLKAVSSGKWVAEGEFNGVAGFRLSELVSPWSSPSKMAVEFIQAKNSPELLKTWVNTSLGETWEEVGEQADPNALISYAESFGLHNHDHRILFLTAGVDVQKDRVEVQIVGWDDSVVPYILSHDVFFGNPIELEVWDMLDNHLKSTFDGKRVAQTFVDSGYLSETVYRFTQKRHGRRIFPVKGDAGAKEAVNRAKQTGAQKVMLVKIGIDPIKRTLLTMLKNPSKMIKFSQDLDDEFYMQLTAEKMVIRKIKGFDKAEFVKTRDRNEALDCFVYAYAAMVALRPNWNLLTGTRKTIEPEPSPVDPVEPVDVREEVKKPPRFRSRPKKRGGFVKNY